MKVKRFDKYKNTKTSWLSEVPSHWEIKKASWLFETKKGSNSQELTQEYCSAHDGIYPVFSGQTKDKGVMGFIDSFEFDAGDEGAVLSTTVGAKAMSIHRITGKFSLSQNCMIITSKDKKVSTKFFSYGLLPVFKHERALIPDHMQPSFRMEDFKQLWIQVPPLNEQISISTFLDRETAKIDDLIAEQERLIELLQEKRQAVISHAVTKGLNPDAPMKDSGVEWLGKVPEHWKTMPIRRLLESLSQGSSPTCLQDPAEEGQYGVLKVGCVNQFEFLPGENKGLPEDEAPDLTSAVLQGDVLMSRGNTRELVGLAAVVQKDAKGLLASDLIFILRFKEALVLPEFATLFLRSDLGRCQIEPRTVGTSASMQKINQSTIKGLTIALPPLEEQREISESMNRTNKTYSDQIHQSSLAIELLKERRSALISAAVTGQIDVRGLAQEAAT